MNKTFDAVKIMREIRDQMSEEMRGMSVQEQIDYIRKKADPGEKRKQQAPA